MPQQKVNGGQQRSSHQAKKKVSLSLTAASRAWVFCENEWLREENGWKTDGCQIH
jgi:hypothetical protein